MSRSERSNPVEQDDIPTWDERDQFFRMRAWFRILVAGIVLLWIAVIIWVLFIANIDKATVAMLSPGANITLVLAPVLVAAVTVERALVAMFTLIEASWPTMVAYLGRGLRWQKSAEIEVKQSHQFFENVSNWYDAEIQRKQIRPNSISDLTEFLDRMDSANRLMSLAQMRVADAEASLSGASLYESYTAVKTVAWTVVGLLLGVIIAALGQFQIFAILGIGSVPARIDVLTTGLVIGGLSFPVHLVFDILQLGKDVLDSIKGYFNRAAPSVQSVTQRITTVQPSIVQPAVVETSTARSTDNDQPDN
jgi:hypothetical protein